MGRVLPIMDYNVYGEALPERGTFFRVQIYERVAISLVELYKRVEKPVISVGHGKNATERANRGIYGRENFLVL